MDRSHIANADNQRQPRSPLADGDGWINPRRIRVPATSRGRGCTSVTSRGRDRILSDSRRRSRESARDDEGLIHHLWSYICRSHKGEPAGSVGFSPTGGVTGGEGGFSLTGCVTGSKRGASPTGGLAGGKGDATFEVSDNPRNKAKAGREVKALFGEGDATFEVSDNPVLSDEEFVRRYVITDSDKVSWERNKVEVEREVKTHFGENCSDP
ncbi:hypothetical protein SASPL_101612 [Salvia splendens]|uniref:Uncharacterized protein n=1 Tax=Salvia splendens TaxID=180675 RepID=A0A8X8YPP8_SALSN|nr:hypothetical protein SASPL_101612 [Salvia splendens]